MVVAGHLCVGTVFSTYGVIYVAVFYGGLEWRYCCCLVASCRSKSFACFSRVLWLYFGFVMNRFRLLWSFLFMNSSFRLVMPCSFLAALIRASSVLQRLLYWGLVRCFLKCESIFFSLRGIPDKNLNIYFGSVPIYDTFYGFVVFCVIHMVKRFSL